MLHVFIFVFFYYYLVGKGIKSSIQVFACNEDFVAFTLYYNGYYYFIGKNLLCIAFEPV